MEWNIETIVFLFFIAFLAGWIDAVAGGGGLLTLPAMLLVGIPATTALATNKLQSSSGTFTSSCYFIKKKAVKLKEMYGMIALTFLGSIIGSWAVLQIDTSALIKIIPFLLIFIGLYFLFSPNKDIDKKRKVSFFIFALLIAPCIGFYDGFFGPGTGNFFTLSFVFFLGYSLSKATAHCKILNFTSNIAALLYFVFFGNIAWLVGFIMIAGQVLGALLGSKMLWKKGAKLIRPVVVIVCFLMAFRIIWQNL